MYIRLEEQVIKFRVSREEAQMLLNGEKLESKTAFSGDFSLTYRVETTIQESSFTSNCCKSLVLAINKQQLMDELEDRPSKEGICISYQEEGVELKAYLVVNLKKPRAPKN